jgi:ribosomal protein S5
MVLISSVPSSSHVCVIGRKKGELGWGEKKAREEKDDEWKGREEKAMKVEELTLNLAENR